MDAETPFRTALVIVISLTMVIGMYHRIRAASSGEKISYKDEGYVFFAVLRLSGICLWMATLAYLISPLSVQWAAFPVPSAFRWFGVAMGFFSSLLMGWTMSCLGRNLTDTVVTREKATLVTQGPYRWVRHPFYVTAAFLMGSVTLLTANWLIGIASLFVLGLLAIRTPREEQKLIDKFGQQYRDYMAKTGRFFPRISAAR